MDPVTFQDSLLKWYDQSKRVLPWRDNPNPYHVWISEIMLQQTRVETVIPYFHRFIETLPTIHDLAHVDDDFLHKLWEGLGYYSRVRNLKQAAIQMVEHYDGTVPSTYDEIISLQGIGPYTAGAILSIAYEQPYTAVDGNVLRVFARLLLETKDIKDPSVKKTIKQQVQSLLPENRIGDFNQALMEIGATVCVPSGIPKCILCPLNEYCLAYQHGKTSDIPVKQTKKQRKIEQRTILVVSYQDKIAIEQRPSKGLLARLYQFPNYEEHLSKEDIKTAYPTALEIHVLSKAKHIFSHIEWHMIGYHIVLKEPLPNVQFVTTKELIETYSIPTAFKAYKNYILGGTNND